MSNASVKMTPEIQAALYAEADVRFWSQTGYKPGKKLDPKNALDAKMLATYTAIYNKVVREFKDGKIVWTHALPVVTDAIAHAAEASSAAADSMNAAAVKKAEADARAHDAAIAAARGAHDEANAHAAAAQQARDDAATHVAAAQEAHAVAAQAAQVAAAQQPISVPHTHVRQAAHEIMQFVMSGGVGHRVGGMDAAAVMQATAAPAHAATVDPIGASGASGVVPGSDLPSFPPTVTLHVPRQSRAELVAVGIASLAAIGVAIYSMSRKPARRTSRRSTSRSFRPRTVPRTYSAPRYLAAPAQ